MFHLRLRASVPPLTFRRVVPRPVGLSVSISTGSLLILSLQHRILYWHNLHEIFVYVYVLCACQLQTHENNRERVRLTTDFYARVYYEWLVHGSQYIYSENELFNRFPLKLKIWFIVCYIRTPFGARLFRTPSISIRTCIFDFERSKQYSLWYNIFNLRPDKNCPCPIMEHVVDEFIPRICVFFFSTSSGGEGG